MRAGFVGWRGMVGSVLMQRMRDEGDFAHLDPVFFSTSQRGGAAPAIGKPVAALRDANDPHAFAGLDVIVTCQGGDWTNAMYPRLRAAGFDGYWIDAASAMRMHHDSVIVLDPVNRHVIDAALDAGTRNFIGGNCTVSLMIMALAGLLAEDLVEWVTCMTYQAASGAGAANMRELVSQMGSVHRAAESLLADPHSPILAIDRSVAAALRDPHFPVKEFGVPLAGSLIPWIDKDLGDGMSKEEWKGGAELNKIYAREDRPLAIESLCVRIGAMRCHSQALTLKLKRDVPLAEIERLVAGANQWVRLVPNTREHSIRELSPAVVTGTLDIAVGRVRKLAMGP
ncbi:MAG: aspartate-semialdehyde dehydrogenase, partial [Casimicrobiaceae bacterium]